MPVPGTASRGTAERFARCEKKPRQGTYSPKGTRWTFSKVPTMRPSGPQATISLRKALDEMVTVTPATTVASSRRASAATSAASGEPTSGRSRAITSSGQSTRDGRAPGWPGISEVAATWALNTADGSTCAFERPRWPPPWTAATSRRAVARPPSGAAAAIGMSASTTSSVATKPSSSPMLARIKSV